MYRVGVAVLSRFFLGLDSRLIIPRQPALRLTLHRLGMTLEHDQVVKRIDTGLMGGRDHGGDQIRDGRPGRGFKKQRILAPADDQVSVRQVACDVKKIPQRLKVCCFLTL